MRRAGQFTSVVRNGMRRRRASLVLYVATDGKGAPGVGIVVNRKVGNAVVRNRVKRRLRAIAAGRIGDLAPGTDLVIRALPAAGRMGFAQLTSDFDGALREILVVGEGGGGR
jgi:ribonuclease P protein component